VAPKEDPLDTLTWLIGQGYTVAMRSVYNGATFHARAVKGDVVLVAEDRELGAVLRRIKIDAEKTIPPTRTKR